MSRSERHSKKKVRINTGRLAASILVLALLVVAVVFGIKGIAAKEAAAKNAHQEAKQPNTVSPVVIDEPKEPETPPEPEYPPDAELTVMCVGDVMGHLSQLYAAYDKASDSYDFTQFFNDSTPYLSSADLAIANIETSFKGKEPYTGYPSFNTPDTLADAVKDAGIDIACFANNHMLDSGLTVLKRGVQMFRDKGFVTSGMRLDASEKRYTLYEAEGVTFGLLNYTYETPRNNGKRTIQSGVLGEEANELINHFGYEENDKDMAAIKEQMELARADGANVIIVFLHWGEEYQHNSNNWQKRIAENLANNGADIIFGSHPHVLQEISYFEVPDGDGTKKVPVFYSLGNYCSNQRVETINVANPRYTEQGMIAEVKLTWSFEHEKIVDMSFGCIPTWVDRYKPNGQFHYAVVPLVPGFEENEHLVASKHVDRAKQALDDVIKLVGEEYVWDK